MDPHHLDYDYVLLIYYMVVLVVVGVMDLVKSCCGPTNELTKSSGYNPRTNQGDSPPGYTASTSPVFTIFSPHLGPARGKSGKSTKSL